MSAALEAVSEEHLHAGYLRIDPEDYGMPLDDEDWQYTREYFDVVRDLWRAAAEAGRAVIFTVDA